MNFQLPINSKHHFENKDKTFTVYIVYNSNSNFFITYLYFIIWFNKMYYLKINISNGRLNVNKYKL